MIANDTPLEAARQWLREQLTVGAPCPCCTQYAKVYRWSLYGTAARALILIYRIGGTETFVHSRELKAHGHTGQGDGTRLRNWGLVVEEKARREDGGRSGYWRVTPHGEAFILGRATIPKYVHVFDNRVLSYEGQQVTIHDALGKKFDYDELMADV